MTPVEDLLLDVARAAAALDTASRGHDGWVSPEQLLELVDLAVQPLAHARAEAVDQVVVEYAADRVLDALSDMARCSDLLYALKAIALGEADAGRLFVDPATVQFLSRRLVRDAAGAYLGWTGEILRPWRVTR